MCNELGLTELDVFHEILLVLSTVSHQITAKYFEYVREYLHPAFLRVFVVD